MSDQTSFGATEDVVLAELVAEIGERLRRGEKVRPEDYPRNAETVRRLLPTIKMMAELPVGDGLSPELGYLDDFRLLREVGHGGMGVVYEAIQVSLGRRVALKVLPNAAALNARQLQRFHLEAQAAASLNHPHIVPVFATGSADGIPYYAMRFIEGRDLARVIRELRRDDLADTVADPAVPGNLPPRSTQGVAYARGAARLARQAAEALEHAHGSDIVHRDIKPSNLMIDREGQLWITDFGVARVRGGLDLTQTGEALGTPRYMSPEQALGKRTPIDGRTDIYSLGVTIYELLTLRPAFPGDDRIEILRQIAQDEPLPPRKIDPSIPIDLETIVLKAMAKAPADRYTTAAELAADLSRFLDNRPILACRPSLADRAAKWMRRHRGFIAIATGGLMVLVTGLFGAVLQYDAWLRRHNAALQAEAKRADRYAEEAQRHAREADRQRNLADRHFFAAQLRLAQQAIEARQLQVASDLLNATALDSRGGKNGDFAWNYLHRLVRRELVQLADRSAQLGDMAASGDGKVAASWYKDSRVVVWDLASGLPFQTIGPVQCRNLVLSEDGSILAAEQGDIGGDSFDQLIAWDTRTGRVLAHHDMGPAGRGRPSWLHLVADGGVLAHRFLAAGGKFSVRTYSLSADSSRATNAPSATLDGLDSVAFPSRAAFLVTHEESCLRVRDAIGGGIRRELRGAYGQASELAITPDGRYLATALGGDLVVVIDLAAAVERARHDFGTSIARVGISPDGNVLAGMDGAGLVHLYDLRCGRSHLIKPDELQSGRQPHCPVFSHDGSRLATDTWGDPGGTQPVSVWEVASGRRLGIIPYDDARVHVVGFSHTDRALIARSIRSPLIWQFDPPSDPPFPLGHKDEAWSANYSPDGGTLATGSDDTDEPQTIKLWDPATGRLIRGWNGGEGTVSSLVFSPDGRIITSGHLAMRNNIRIWDVATGSLLRTLEGHRDFVRCVAWSPDGRMLATGGGSRNPGGKDWTVRLWDVSEATCMREFRGHTSMVRSLDFSPDGQTLASASDDTKVRLWEVGTGRLLQTQGNSAPLVGLAFLPDGQTLAVADDTGAVTIRGAVNLAILRTIRGPSDKLLNMALSPDGDALATCGMAGVIRLWDTVTGQQLLVLKGHKDQVNGIAFAPDGSSLTSCSHDGEVKLWLAGRAGTPLSFQP
ncbi:MAG: protein kinase domain-containing protein [Isosphaeraceae bacterium]